MANEFERMMAMEGVRPLDQSRAKPDRPIRGRSDVSRSAAATPPAESVGSAWVAGERARTALETALQRVAAEFREGGRGWATGIRQDGTSVILPAASGAAALLAAADRQSLRLMIVGGDGWTFVMHPTMGVATLDADPSSAG